MRFAVLTDTHLGPEGYYKGILRKMNKNAKLLLKEFVKKVKEKEKIDFLIVLGDLVEDDNKEKDKKNLQFIVKQLKELDCPVYFVAGNHDLKNISEKELAIIFSQKKLYYSFETENFCFITLLSKRVKEKILVSETQKKWLEKKLKKTNKKCVVFVHHGLADQKLKGNPWFEGREKDCLIENRKEIRKILSESGKVIAVFNSHLHWNKKDVHGKIPFFTIQSFVENEKNKGKPSKAYAIAGIDSKKIEVKIKGNYPAKFSHSIQGTEKKH